MLKISLKQKKLNSGKISLYLEYYKGSKIDDNGKEIHNREFEYLGKEIGYLLSNPLNAIEKKEWDEFEQVIHGVSEEDKEKLKEEYPDIPEP